MPKVPKVLSGARFCPPLLGRKQRSLRSVAPPVTPYAAGFGDHAVAGNDDGDGVGRAGAATARTALGLPMLLATSRIGAGLAVGDALQLAPHFPLKRGGLDVDRQIERRRIAAKMPCDRLDPFAALFRVAFDSAAGYSRRKSFARAASLSPIFTEHTPSPLPRRAPRRSGSTPSNTRSACPRRRGGSSRATCPCRSAPLHRRGSAIRIQPRRSPSSRRGHRAGSCASCPARTAD